MELLVNEDLAETKPSSNKFSREKHTMRGKTSKPAVEWERDSETGNFLSVVICSLKKRLRQPPVTRKRVIEQARQTHNRLKKRAKELRSRERHIRQGLN